MILVLKKPNDIEYKRKASRDLLQEMENHMEKNSKPQRAN